MLNKGSQTQRNTFCMMFDLGTLNYIVKVFTFTKYKKARRNGDREQVHGGALGACNTTVLDLGDGSIDIHYLTFCRNCTFRFLYKLKPMFYMYVNLIRQRWGF